MYVCMYACIYAHEAEAGYICMYVHIYLCMYVCIYIYAHDAEAGGCGRTRAIVLQLLQLLLQLLQLLLQLLQLLLQLLRLVVQLLRLVLQLPYTCPHTTAIYLFCIPAEELVSSRSLLVYAALSY